MTRAGRPVAFSLIEVVIATAVFATAVVSIVALLPLTARLAAGALDLETAARLCDAVRIEARRLVPPANYADFTGLQLVAAHDGTAVRQLDPAETVSEKYFLVEVVPYGRTPLQAAAGIPLLVVSARITWPFRPPLGGGPAAPDSSSLPEEFRFAFALRP